MAYASTICLNSPSSQWVLPGGQARGHFQSSSLLTPSLYLLVGTASCLPSSDLVTISASSMGKGKLAGSLGAPQRPAAPLGAVIPTVHGLVTTTTKITQKSSPLAQAAFARTGFSQDSAKTPPSQRDHADSLPEAFLLASANNIPQAC